MPDRKLRRQAVAEIVEQKQAIADELKMPIVDTAFLLAMHRALAEIRVEHDAVGVVQ